ncbi:hypothetical protein EMPS_06968 [Entomortierella parvispora]|uniref:F-box domain-containing protein n=1 Tax=Entomortierella parvispora TaxID=205924 RepID=A0A9P3HD92_9FUNG|nr:hypothetical protein EMPS_06968 [Entomortierella parvispora]
MPWPPGTLKATKIRDLTTTTAFLQTNMDLLRSNPQLSALNLKCCWRNHFDSLHPAFESVSSLKSLQVTNATIGDPKRFIRFLSHNYGLEKLTLSEVKGLVVFESCERLSQMTDIRLLDISWRSNSGLVQLFLCTPNLRTLDVYVDDDCPFAELARTLQRRCPQLASIKCRWCEREEAESETVAIIQAASRLTHFSSCPSALTDNICDAFLAHANWIETIDLVFDGWNREYTAPSLGRIMVHCRNLRHLKIRHGHGHHDRESTPPEEVQWPREPWGCLQLEIIALGGFVFEHEPSLFVDPTDEEPALDESEEVIPHHSKVDMPFIRDISSRGWVYTVKYPDFVCSTSTNLRLMRNWIFEHTRDFSELHTIKAENYEYLNLGRKSRMAYNK